MREYWKRNPEKYAAMLARQVRNKNSTKTYRRNKDKPAFREAKRMRDRADWAKHQEKRANAAGARLYGLSVDDYLARKQHGCDICGNHNPRGGNGGWMHIDHCHMTGQIRGTLCKKCNTALGAFKDDPELLEKALDYLNHWKAKAVA